MRTINKVFLLFLVYAAASNLSAQNALSSEFTSSKAEINTFLQTVEEVGELTATFQSDDGSVVTASKLEDTSFLIRKINVKGQRQWERRLNFQIDKGDALAFINAIAQTKDGGYVLAGHVGCSDLPFECGASAATLIKLRRNGAVQWKTAYTAIEGYFFTSITPTAEGGVIAVGGRRAYYGDPKKNELVVANFTSTGKIVWNKSFKSNPAVRIVRSALPLIKSVATPDGVIIAFTKGIDPNATGVDVMKLDNSGDVVWNKFLNSQDFVFQSMGATPDDGVFLFGTCPTCTNKSFAIALRANGTLSWKAEYLFNVPITIKSVSNPVHTPDGGYVLAGYAVDNSRNSDFGIVLKIGSSRNIEFLNTIGNTYAVGPEFVKSVFNTSDGGLIIFAQKWYTPKDIAIVKLNSEGMSPGCINYLETEQFGSTAPNSFALSITDGKFASTNSLLKPFDFGLSAVVTNHPLSIICK